jgi:acyl carrier protein
MDSCSKVRDFIVENFLFGDGVALREDTSFLDEGIIDSTGILELVFFIEETLDMSIKDDKFVPENMDSLQNITRFIDRKLSGISSL